MPKKKSASPPEPASVPSKSSVATTPAVAAKSSPPRAATARSNASEARSWSVIAAAAVGLLVGVTLAVGFSWRRGASTTDEALRVGDKLPAQGPWGELVARSVLLEPPVEAIADIADDCSRLSTVWQLPGWDRPRLEALAASLPDPFAGQALRAHTECHASGCSTTMPLEVRERWSTDTRKLLYPLLGRYENMEFSGGIKLPAAEVENWLTSAVLQIDARDAARKLFYPDGGSMSFADTEIICRQLPSRDDRLVFVRSLFAANTLLVHLRVRHDERLDPLLNYWAGGHRRRKNIEPVLRSLAVAQNGGDIDLSHVLPSLARKLLYTFPPENDDKLNCHWTTLNFGRTEPTDEYLDDQKMAEAFRRDFSPIDPSGRRYGDVVLFTDAQGRIFHSVVYLADNIVFTKNGRSSRRPWVLSRLDEVKTVYPHAPVLTFLRRRPPQDLAN